MKVFPFSKRNRCGGFTVLGILIAIGILSAMGAGMAVLMATNQSTRTQQLYTDQAFYNSQAGIEYALGQILTGGSSDTSFTRNFLGETITLNRVSGQIQVATTRGVAQASYSITDPSPPSSAACLSVDQSSKSLSGSSLLGLVLSRDVSCSGSLTITDMVVSWDPDLEEKLRTIQIDSSNVYSSGSGQASGSTFDITDVTINDSSDHPLNTLTWNTTITNHDFTITFNLSDGTQKTVEVTFLANNQANYLSVGTASVMISKVAGIWKRITGMTIGNTGADPIRLSKITVSWSPDLPSINLSHFYIDGSNVLTGTAANGESFDVDVVIPASTTYDVDYFQFSQETFGRAYSIVWEFTDATTTTTAVNIFDNNQDTCLSLDTTSATIGGSGSKEIQGMTLTNSCSLDLGITSVTISWSGDTSKRVKKIDIDGNTSFSGTVASGDMADFSNDDVYLRNEVGTIDIDFIQFSSAVVAGTTYTMVWAMTDGTTKSTSVSVASEANSLTVDTSGAEIGGSGDKDLIGITITNAGSSSITWDRVIVTWTGSSRKMQVVRVNGSDVWSGNVNSGSNQNITDVTLSASQTKSINYIRFNGDMSTRTFTIEFIMQDGSSVVTPSFTPPDA